MFTRYLAGLGFAATASFGALVLSWVLDLPLILLGLVLGLLLQPISDKRPTGPGLALIAKHGLRLGIVLLGTQISVTQVAALGWTALAALLLVMAVAIGVAVAAARLVGANLEVGLLAGGGTAICGATAALAIHGAIGRDRIAETQFTLTLIVLAGASALAFLSYPLIADLFNFSDRQAGFLFGAGIHDAAQAIGAGYVVSDSAGTVATITKLSRIALLAPLVALMALMVKPARADEANAQGRPPLIPGFIAAFMAMIALNSLVDIPQGIAQAAFGLSKALLLLAVTATALRTRLGALGQLGWHAAMPVAAATLASFATSLFGAVWIVG